jgi:hypothetical protein
MIHSDAISQKVGGCFLDDLLLSPPGVGVESNVVFVHILVEFQEGGLVVAAIAVVGSAEDGRDAIVVLQLVALVH